MPTLLQINTVVNTGSTGRIAEEIGQTALAAGWRSVIAYGRNPRPSKSELIRIGNDWNVRLHGLRTRIFDDHGFGSRRDTERFLREVEKLNPDVIHLHNIHGYYLNIELLFNWLARRDIPIFWTLHDCWPFTGHCAYFSFIGCDRWESGCFSCPQKTSYPSSYVFDRSRKNWEQKRALFSSLKKLTLVPVSDWLAKLTQESFLGNARIERIYNGIDTSVFSPATDEKSRRVREKYGLGKRFVILGCANIWGERKGFSSFLQLRERLDEKDFAIVLVGVSQEQQKNLPNGILGIQRTESVEELAELYAVADLFLNPTFEDNFPTTNIEALACGTPVCTYRTGGSVEAVTPETGFVVEQGDIDGLISAVNCVRAQGKAFYSNACRSRAVEHFRKENRWADCLNLYGAFK